MYIPEFALGVIISAAGMLAVLVVAALVVERKEKVKMYRQKYIVL